MAISISIYSNSNTSSKTVTFDVQSSLLASSYDTLTGRTALDHYIVSKSSAKQDDGSNTNLATRAIIGLGDFPLQGPTGNSHSRVTSTTAYANVTALVNDYLWDYVYGHTADQSSTGVSVQAPMKFS